MPTPGSRKNGLSDPEVYQLLVGNRNIQRYYDNMHKLTKLSIAIAVFILGLGITWSQTQKKLVSKRFRKTPKGMWE